MAVRICLLFIVFFTARAWAHPHDYVMLSVEPVVNEGREIVALKERWLFTPFSAQSVLEPVLKLSGYEAQKQAFAEVSDEMQTRLQGQHFYTFPEDLFADAVEDFALEVDERGDLWLSFTLKVEAPSQALVYQIYEPTYWVAMLYDEQQSHQWTNGCQMLIEQANPTEADFLQASMLDINARGAENLGAVFADTARLDCS